LALTITPATPQLHCSILNFSPIVDPGQSLQVQISFEGGVAYAPVDWQHATYQIRFVGNNAAHTVTSAALTPDGQDVVTVAAPTQFDWYNQTACIFSGTSNFTAATGGAINGTFLVSAKHALGSVQFTSVPWPLVVNQPAQIDVIFHAAPGGPVPTGSFNLGVGNTGTNVVAIGPNGETTGTLQAFGSLTGVTQVVVYYRGDPYYDASSAAFPMPSGPPSGGSGGGPGGGAHPTATVARTPSPAGTATAQGNIGGVAGIPTGTAVPASTVTQPSTIGGTGLPWWLVLLGVLGLLVLVAGGGVGGWLYLSRRAAGRQASHQVTPLPVQGQQGESG
jgi:hypothetical protein